MKTIRKFVFSMGLFGGLQFLLLTSLAMVIYPGGTIHNPHWDSYSFLYNYFSDLGRTKLFNGLPNTYCHYLFKLALTTGGTCLILFFLAMPSLFQKGTSRALGILAAFFGLLAGWSYIGIAWVPWDVSYWGHVRYVRMGFLAFLAMSMIYTAAIFVDGKYPRRYAYFLLFFTLILAVQVVIMLFGPRAYRSNEALFLQAVAQKVVVYAEIGCMLYMSYGALKVNKARHDEV